MSNVNASLPLSNRVNALSAPGTSSMRIKANALKEKGVHVVNFAAGELYFDACPGMKIGATGAIQNKGNRYTPPIGLPQLRTILAEKTSHRCNALYTASEIAITAGAKQALFNAALIVLNPGDEVIVPTPYWETFPTQVRLAQATPVFINTALDDFKLTYEAVKSAITDRTKMIVINTPNNPTGAVYEESDLLLIAKLAYEKNIWILFDECYREFVRTPNKHFNIVELFEPIKRQTILVNSFSKSHAITGWRVGYASAPSHVISAMHNLQGHTTSNPSSLAQFGALHATLNESGDFLADINQFLSRQLDIARSYLDTIPGISYAPPEGAFYIYINISEKLNGYYRDKLIEDVDVLSELLLIEAHIAVVPGASSGDKNSIRISYGLEEEELRLGLERLRDFMKEVKR